ncbi:FAD-dependent oxidoreductase [Devosia sp.]|uniref:FAD-dependent oxidoreductase n=1 Tax=Devosia sp. TaxID=1871048 RepID=UPI001B0CBBAE|nr:FAD-dependent oxidoreductase [Devosia sp.]MBO9588294.1 FAD-dependent oxidoreductase [Devosia sp.]
MRPQTNRLPATTGKGLAGAHIDRTRPIRFTINGRVTPGFQGDTVLSALLGAGVDTIGTHAGLPLGLRAGAAPAIAYAAKASLPEHALPMERTPARDGAEYRIVAEGPTAGLFARLFQPGRTLGLALDTPNSLVRPWRSIRGEKAEPTDLIVVGGGVAGMAAALAGAHAGLKVTLIEASPHLGGHSGLFGTQDGESTPEENVATLTAEIAVNPTITVLTHAEVFAIGEGVVRVHQLDITGERVESRVVDLPARHTVLATGAFERLPVLPGNRLPGIAGAQEAFELAYRYGIWPGQSWLLATSANPAYRLATLLAESNIGLDRILDGRDQASSRYIEFCKAYGFRQFPGTIPLAVTPGASGRLLIGLPHGEPVAVDRLVLCGGWQPDLTLWHLAGGGSRWNIRRERLEPIGEVPGLVLAGSAAGHFTRRGCVTSGIHAVDRLLGRPGQGVDDPVIDAFYETPDRQMHVADSGEAPAPTYLDADNTLMLRPAPPPRRRWTHIFRGSQNGPVRVLSEAPQPLSIGAICAGVSIGLIPPDSAGVVAQERVALVPLTGAPPPQQPAAEEASGIPSYLADRFGHDAIVAMLRHDPSRQLGSGALIFEGEDTLDPRRAVGVVLRTRNGKTEALVAASVRNVVVRDLGQAIPAEVEP